MPPDSKETELGSRDQEASPSAGKNTRMPLVPCRAWKCVPTAISRGVDISEVPECHLLRQMSSQWGSQKLFQGLVSYELTAYLSLFNLFLIQWIMAILSKGCKPDNFLRKDSFTQMHGLGVMWKVTSFCTELISRKLCRFLLLFSTSFTSLSVLLLFPLSITFFVVMYGCWFYFV